MADLESNYITLCKLHDRYKYLVTSIVKNAYSRPVPSMKMSELNSILKEIETLPISWKFYRDQHNKFVQDFEDLVIFYDKSDIDI